MGRRPDEVAIFPLNSLKRPCWNLKVVPVDACVSGVCVSMGYVVAVDQVPPVLGVTPTAAGVA